MFEACGWTRTHENRDIHFDRISGYLTRWLYVKWRIEIKTNVFYRFSAFWLRSKCSICSYQLNIWYPSNGRKILKLFLIRAGILGLAPFPARVALVSQYVQVRGPPTFTQSKLFYTQRLYNPKSCLPLQTLSLSWPKRNAKWKLERNVFGPKSRNTCRLSIGKKQSSGKHIFHS